MAAGNLAVIARSAAGLREAMFRAMEDLRSGGIDVAQAKQIAALGMVIVKSVEVQIVFERARLEDAIPSHLSEMKLIPPLDQKP